MYYSRLLMLSEIIKDKKIIELDNYFSSLNMNTNNNIEVYQISKILEIDNKLVSDILYMYVDKKILIIRHAIRCLECGLLLKDILLGDIPNEFECYSCDLKFDVTAENIEILFALKDLPVFNLDRYVKK